VRDGENLWLVARVLGHDHQGRGAAAFDVELDAPHAIEWHVQGMTIAGQHHQAPIGHHDRGVTQLGAKLNGLVEG
jgi:hypothetical protein